MYPIAGNHDTGPGLSIFETYFGVDDYTFDFANTHFVGLSTAVDNNAKGRATTEQFNWLETALDTTKTHTLSFFHHPLSAPTWATNGECCYIDTTNRNQLAQIIDEHDVPLLLTGHSHGYDYRFLTSTDVPTIQTGFYQLISGGAGGKLAQPDGQHHFVLIHVTPDDITHTMIPTDTFDTAVEYQTNDGTSTTATTTVTNSTSTDLPYVRLKFKLSPEEQSYVIYDSNGQYHSPTYSYDFPEYKVIYLETAAPANSAVTYTVTAPTTLDTTTTNIVSPTGTIKYLRLPDSTATLLPQLAVRPTSSRTKISKLQWQSNIPFNYAWQEKPLRPSTDTTYTITNLPSNQLFSISVTEHLYDRADTDSTGQLQFTYTANVPIRTFDITLLDTVYPDDIVIAPHSNGQPQIRMFNNNGRNVTNWVAFNNTASTHYEVRLANLTAAEKLEVIVSNHEGNIELYTHSGTLLQTLRPYTVPSKPILITSADLTGDGLEEIITVSHGRRNPLKVYTYDSVTQRWIVLQHFKLSKKLALKPQALTAGIVNDSGQPQIILLAHLKNGAVLQTLTWDGTSLTSKIQKLPAASTTAVTLGNWLGTQYNQIAVLLNNTLQLYSSSATGKLSLLEEYELPVTKPGNIQLLALAGARISDDLLIAADQSNTIESYQLLKNGELKQQPTIQPFDQSYNGGIILSVVATTDQLKPQLITAQLGDQSAIKLWQYQLNQGWKAKQRWLGYDSNFKGGISLSKLD
jgi:hypothetical protein